MGEQSVLRLGKRSFSPGQLLLMAIVNRTPDSFFRPGETWDEQTAMERARQAIAEGADIIDIGGVPAAPGQDVGVREEIRRTAGFIAAVRGGMTSSPRLPPRPGRRSCARTPEASRRGRGRTG
jgi:dihydropteroate synthase